MSTETVYKRLSIHQRIQHIMVIVSFTLLAFSGLPIRYATSAFTQKLVHIMGGFDHLLYFHLANGSILILAFLYHLIYAGFTIAGKKQKWDILPKGKDFIDVVQNLKYMLGLSQEKPKFGRFSYVEKFDYWAVFWGMFIIGISGVLMWFPEIGIKFFPRWLLDAYRLGHSDEAVLAVIVIVVWHFYNVHFNPRVFPYNSTWWNGNIDQETMVDHHPLELARINLAGKTGEVHQKWPTTSSPDQKA